MQKRGAKGISNWGTLLAAGFLWALAFAALPAGVGRAQQNPSDLTELSLEELMNIEVTSVSKKPEKRWEAAAALYVITGDAIRRSGATSIPEALRLAPGVHVARIDANKWVVSIRGFSGRFTNKLLVLIDGRSVYTPLFAGVYWDVQDTALEDVARIEVIRGPGGTVWGANAVNGVINVITKGAEDTQGVRAVAGGGTEEKSFAAARWGGSVGSRLYYRAYMKYFERAGGEISKATAYDDWGMFRTGFRVDWSGAGADSLTVQGDVYHGDSGERVKQRNAQGAPAGPFEKFTADVFGANVLARWTRTLGAGSEAALQVYYDRTDRKEQVFEEGRDTVDVDFQHRLALRWRQEVVWGAHYRLTSDDLRGTLATTLSPTRNDQLVSVFLEDELSLLEDRLRLTIGSKFEHNDYSGFEAQPSAHLLYLPVPAHALWAAVSRAVRTPSRAGDGIVVTLPIEPRAIRTGKAESEDLLAFELGYRVTPLEHLFLDVSGFFNQYDNLATVESGASFPDPDSCTDPGDPSTCTRVITPAFIDNKLSGDVYGAELAGNWMVLDWWRVNASYSYLRMALARDANSTDAISEAAERSSPRHQASVHSSVDLPEKVSVDATLRYVDNLSTGRFPGFTTTPSYVELDARIGWRPVAGIELSLVGRNLLHGKHREFNEPSFSPLAGTDVERSVYGKLTWRY